jgi:transcriptional regulator of acetoin/glycerol metabolism
MMPVVGLRSEIAQSLEIARSWRRSELSGLKPSTPINGLPVGDIDNQSRLLRAAVPVLDGMAQHLADTRFCVVLADSECWIVARRFGERSVARTLDELGAVQGCQFLEETTGTNAIATPFELRRGISVRGDEHFLDAFKQFTCYGHPIVHPATRRLAGVLDITGLAGDSNPLLVPFLVHAVTDIEQRLLSDSKQAEQRLLAAFQSAQHRASAVLALGDDVVLANTAAVHLVDAADHAMLRDLARTQRGVRHLELTSGTAVEVRVEAVSANAGMLFEIAPLRPDGPPVPRHRSGRGVLPIAIEDRLRRSGQDRRRVLISGEPGTGRTAAAKVIAGREPVVQLDAADVPSLGQTAWLARLTELAGRHQGLVVVEAAHLLPPVLAASVTRLLDTSSAWLALTTGPSDELHGEHAALASHVHRRVELPPLRDRRGDIPNLARTILTALRPARSLRLTADALELLAAQSWPGNLRELETVLCQAIERRSVGDITARDLAPSCPVGAATPQLSGWEQAEQEAITKALQANGGNKVHAAKQLGISRSTLYNRIRALRITG